MQKVEIDVQSNDSSENDQSHSGDEGLIYIKHGEEFEIYDNPKSEHNNSDNDESDEFDEFELAAKFFAFSEVVSRDRSLTSNDARLKQKEILNDVDTLLNMLSSAKAQITSNGKEY